LIAEKINTDQREGVVPAFAGIWSLHRCRNSTKVGEQINNYMKQEEPKLLLSFIYPFHQLNYNALAGLGDAW
jgi:hypothetical protein